LEAVEVPSRFEIDDELWAEVQPLIPVRERRRRYPGRKAIGDRLVLNGISHVLHTRRLRIRYERDPEMHTAFLTLACAILCWRRLRTPNDQVADGC
jgi:hypothetical protein